MRYLSPERERERERERESSVCVFLVCVCVCVHICVCVFLVCVCVCVCVCVFLVRVCFSCACVCACVCVWYVRARIRHLLLRSPCCHVNMLSSSHRPTLPPSPPPHLVPHPLKVDEGWTSASSHLTDSPFSARLCQSLPLSKLTGAPTIDILYIYITLWLLH